MQSGNQETFITSSQKSIILIFFAIVISALLVFKNFFFKPVLLLKNFGESSIEPEIAFKNDKPTFLEFYAEWCEVCKEMAPKVSSIKNQYEKEINFVFLNVDNPKWEIYLRKFNVNGIPQINLLDSKANLKDTFIGRQEEKIIKQSLENFNGNFQIKSQNQNSEFSLIKKNKNYKTYPRGHG